MASISSQTSETSSERREPHARLTLGPMWTSLSISVIWIVVLADALFGPDIVTSNAGGFARVPSAIVVVFFAWLATWVIARHGFGDRDA